MTDAVVIGSGVNGLVAANLLADAGWSVLVLEGQPTAGGAVRSDTDVTPGFVHDTFSAFYPFAAASPAMQHLRLEEWGLTWSHAPAVVGTPLPTGGWALMHRQADDTAAALEADAPGDGAAWLGLWRAWKTVGSDVIEALLGPYPPWAAVRALVADLRRAEGRLLAARMATSVRHLSRRDFAGEAARVLLTGNAMHADFRPSSVGSGAFGLVFSMLAQQFGFPTPTGGAGALTAALQRRLEVSGGVVQTSCAVAAIDVRAGRAVGVLLEDRTSVSAHRAVLADVSAPALYGQLVPSAEIPRRVRWGMRRFTWDPGTVKVDWALSGPVPWADRPVASPATVHIAHSVGELSETAEQLQRGLVPRRPFLLVGQMTTADLTRSPPGTESLWAYCHVPQRVRGDAGDDGITGTWDADDCARMADRMQARIARFAPGLDTHILARRVLGPRELQALDVNLHGGAVNGGTALLRQAGPLRPVPGAVGPRTPIEGLYLASASAHPGGGVHGAPGANAARAALRDG